MPETPEDINSATGLTGVWKDKFAPGQPTYKLLSDGIAQYIKADDGPTTTVGFGKWELTNAGQVKVSCKTKSGCTAEKDGVGGTEEHELSMHAMMFEGVFKRLRELNARDELRVKMISEGKDPPPVHPIIVVDLDDSELSFDLFRDEKLADLTERLGSSLNPFAVLMLGTSTLDTEKTMYEQVPANGVLRLVIPKPGELEEPAADPAPAPVPEAGKKEKITEAFSKWDVNNEKVISEQQLTAILLALGVPKDDIPTIYADAGVSQGAGVDYSKFINWIYSAEEQETANEEYTGPMKEKLDIVKWFFPYVPQPLILDMLETKKGDRASVTQALQKREDDLAAQYGSKVDGLIKKVPKAEKAAVLEALSASGGDEEAALKTLAK